MDRTYSTDSSGGIDPEKNNDNGRKKPFYRRASVHHFHVMKDQMACCCCVPLGMAYHLIACLDFLFGIFLVVETLEYFEQAQDEYLKIAQPAKSLYYSQLTISLGVAAMAYSLPRVPMYLATLWRRKSYGKLKYYFRTRIFTFIALLLDVAFLFFMVFGNIDELAIEYDSTTSWILMQVGAFALFWLGVDLYWSIAIRTYKDSKKGKQGRQAAQRLSKTLDPNNFLENQTCFNPTMQD